MTTTKHALLKPRNLLLATAALALAAAFALPVTLASSAERDGTATQPAATHKQADDHAGHDHGPGEGHAEKPAGDHAEGDGHDHDATPAATDKHDHASEAGGHDHAAEAACTGEDGCADEHGGEGGHADEVTLTPEALRENGIRTQPARRQALGQALTVPGRVAYNSEAMAHIATPVQGRVAEVRVRLGDSVQQGDVLLVLDSPALGEAQSALLQRRTDVEVARSAAEVARLAAERAKRLHEGQGIALGEYQRREGEAKAAQGMLRAAEAAATAAENALRLLGMTRKEIAQLTRSGEINPRTTVRAPLAGRVVQREVTLGEVVGPERDGLLVLADLRTLWVLADVPEQRIGQLAEGATASVSLDALSGRAFDGRVTHIAPELNRETRTVQVRIEIADGGAPIKPGMFAHVQLAAGAGPVAEAATTTGTQAGASSATPPAALVVPAAAVHNFEGGTAVFVAMASEPGTFAARPVKLGPPSSGLVPVLEGLEEGAPVVVAGAFIIKAELAKGIMEGKTCSGH